MITGNELKLTESFIDKVADSVEQAEAVKKVLGFNAEVEKVTEAHTPERAPWVPPVFNIDQMAHITEWVEQCQARVDSFPDDDPTPLKERERCLILAKRDLARLEAKNAATNG